MTLRKDSPEAAFGAARAEVPPSEAPTYWICLALLLAVVVLGVRIASSL